MSWDELKAMVQANEMRLQRIGLNPADVMSAARRVKSAVQSEEIPATVAGDVTKVVSALTNLLQV